MLIKIGPDVAEIRQQLMQDSLDKLEAKLNSGLRLHGALAAELGVDTQLLRGANAHVKTEWDTYQAQMTGTSDIVLMRQYTKDFHTLEGL